MTTELKVKIKRSFLDNYHRPLHLHSEFIKFEDKDFADSSFTIFKASEIKDFRYGINWISYYFIFGREYQLYVRNYNDEVLKIKFNSFFGVKKKQKHDLYVSILNTLWNLYFSKKVKELIHDFEEGESFFIGDVVINPDGVIISVSKLMKQEKVQVLWRDLRFRLFSTYFSIYSKENPIEVNRGYSYKEDWNTFVLYNVIKTILSNKNINND